MGRIILLLLKLGICISFASAQSGLMQDGTIEQLVFAQAAVMNTPEEATLVAIKYEDATVLLDIRKKVDHFATLKASGEKDESCVSYANPNFRVMMLGNKADVLTAKVLCSELDANSRLNEGVELSAARMALHLADEAQRCSMELSASRQLAFNALVLNTNTPHNTHSNNGGFGDIYKVDVSGNFQRCKAVCIGAREGRINSWLGTRGRFIASRLATKGRNANINVTTAAMGNNNTAQLVQDNKVFVDGNVRTDDGGAGIEKALAEDSICCSSVENCLNISTCCLLENYQRDAIYSGNYSMCVTVMCAGESEARTGTGSVSTIVG